ncbi:hypothetical protein V7S43_013004 [Phytophthora oleae]|uniref:Crinkler effector protein N-terminal domain-containing protein n=1 Tax=Phytophthora oleae TaxID=2107226 RepID=A0ABD3F5S2_9STRA
MMKLFCAVVGVAGSAFEVDIDADQFVGDLKVKIQAAKMYQFPADEQQLFLTKPKDGAWLRSDDPDVISMRSGAIPEQVKKLLVDEIDPAEEIGDLFGGAPTKKMIHVLVVVTETGVSGDNNALIKKQRLEWQSARRGSHTYDPNSQYFQLEKEDMDESGLPPVRLMLYCRPTFHRQLEFLREKVLNEGHLGWILGPHGTGKSTTAMAFASTVDRSKWIITWIHVSKSMTRWRCVRLTGDERKTRRIGLQDVEEVLEVDDKTKRHMVLVDGLAALDAFIELTSTCIDWFLLSKEKRRLAFVCSMSSRGKVDEDLEIETGAVEFPVYSWTLDEYHVAIQDDEVWTNVSPYLDAPQVLPSKKMSRESREDMVQSKYYYAGGSCRYMFGFSTASVMGKLTSAVESLDTAATHATSGQRSSSTINRLHAMFQRPNDVGVVSPVISQYAATLIAVTCGPEAIKMFMSTHRDSSNPALNGWMLEIVFFASLRNGGLDLVDAAGNKVATWNQSVSTILVTDGIPAFSSAEPVWIRPKKWNQGGYDAIMVCKRTQYVRMVQVTSAHKHSFRIDHFYKWLDMLSKSSQGFTVKKLEIFFVVEQEKLSAFGFGNVYGEGLLAPFHWKKGKETEKVKIVGIRGLYNLSGISVA